MEIKKDTPLLAALSWTLPTNIVAGMLNFFGQIIFARILGIKAISQYGLIVVSTEMVLLFFSFGFNQAAIKKLNNTRVFSAAYTLITLQSITFLFCYVIFCFFHNISSAESSYYYGLAYVISRIIGLYTTLAYAPLEGALDYKHISIYRLVSISSGMCIGLCLGFYYPGTYILLIRDFLVATILFLLIKKKCPHSFSFTSKTSDLKYVWKFCRPIWLLNLLERGAIRGNYTITALILGGHDFGIYFQVRNIFEGLLGFIVQPIQTVVYSYFCKEGLSIEKFRKILIFIYPVCVVAMLMIAYFSMTTTFGSVIIENVLGREWVAGGIMVGWLSIYVLSLILFEFSKVFAIACDNKKPALIGRISQILFLLIFMVPVINGYGLAGAASITAAGGILLFMITSCFLVRKNDS